MMMRKLWAEFVLSKLPIPPITDYSRLVWRMYDLMYKDGSFSRTHIYNGCNVTDFIAKMRDVAEGWQLEFTVISNRECLNSMARWRNLTPCTCTRSSSHRESRRGLWTTQYAACIL